MGGCFWSGFPRSYTCSLMCPAASMRTMKALVANFVDEGYVVAKFSGATGFVGTATQVLTIVSAKAGESNQPSRTDDMGVSAIGTSVLPHGFVVGGHARGGVDVLHETYTLQYEALVVAAAVVCSDNCAGTNRMACVTSPSVCGACRSGFSDDGHGECVNDFGGGSHGLLSSSLLLKAGLGLLISLTLIGVVFVGFRYVVHGKLPFRTTSAGGRRGGSGGGSRGGRRTYRRYVEANQGEIDR